MGVINTTSPVGAVVPADAAEECSGGAAAVSASVAATDTDVLGLALQSSGLDSISEQQNR